MGVIEGPHECEELQALVVVRHIREVYDNLQKIQREIRRIRVKNDDSVEYLIYVKKLRPRWFHEDSGEIQEKGRHFNDRNRPVNVRFNHFERFQLKFNRQIFCFIALLEKLNELAQDLRFCLTLEAVFARVREIVNFRANRRQRRICR